MPSPRALEWRQCELWLGCRTEHGPQAEDFGTQLGTEDFVDHPDDLVTTLGWGHGRSSVDFLPLYHAPQGGPVLGPLVVCGQGHWSHGTAVPCLWHGVGMCRSIVTLRSPEAVPDEDVRAAALQYVRKVSGYRAPSEANRAAFERAVDDIALSTRSLLDGLVSGRPGPKVSR